MPERDSPGGSSGSARTPQEYHPPVEEYLETMLALGEEGVPVIQARIAERLGRSAPSVSEMLERLLDEGYVTRKGRLLSLTDSGRALAERVVRKHRLAERLLVDVIGLEWHKVHREAGRWEHVISDDVEARLVELLGDPATCPHGNPIPGSHTSVQTRAMRPLAEVSEGERVRLLRISEEVEMHLNSLALLDQGGFIPGAVARVGGRDDEGNIAVIVEDGGTPVVHVPRDLSDRLFVATPERPVTLRVEADAVFTVDAAERVLVPGAVEIGEDGRISWVGDPCQVPAEAGTEVRHLGGIVMPGLVNCHGHSPMTLVRSAGDGLPLDRWLTESVWPREARLTDDDVYWGMALGAAELLGNGVTTSCEQYRHPGPVMQALRDSGIRAVYTPGIFEVPGSGPGNSWEALLDEACGLFDSLERAADGSPEGPVEVGFGPHAAYTVPPEGLQAIASEARRRDALLQIHLSETVAECDLVRRRYGMSAPEFLASLGALEGRVLAAHAVWLDEADLNIVVEHDVAVAHCPGSNGKLGVGVAPLRALIERGVRVGLGTDGPASNDDLHLWDEMRLAALFARAQSADPEALSSPAALRLATRGGAEALGLDVGALEPGRPADLIRLRTDDARFTPAVTETELLGHLVWAGAGYLVTDVWVGGVHVVDSGQCRGVDEEQARTEVVRRARRLLGP